MKRIIAIVLLTAFAFVASGYSQAASAAKVVAVEGTKIQIALSGEAPAWLKKGAVAKIAGVDGKVIHAASKVTEGQKSTFTLTVKEKTDLKAGDAISLQKGKALTGC